MKKIIFIFLLVSQTVFSQFTVNDAFKKVAIPLTIGVSGSIGTAPNTVDIASVFKITASATGLNFTLPNPSDITDSDIVEIVNVGTNSFTAYGVNLLTGEHTTVVWTGTIYTPEKSLPAAQYDFWRSGVGGTTFPDGTSDVTENKRTSGNVGISIDPTAKLHILSNDNVPQTPIIIAAANNQTQAINVGWAGLFKSDATANSSVEISAKGTGNILLGSTVSQTPSTGNVGIGRTAPRSKLDVGGGFSANITTVGSLPYTASVQNDHTLLVTSPTSGIINLPTPTGNTGIEFEIIISDNISSAVNVTVTTPVNFILNPITGTTATTLVMNVLGLKKAKFITDGNTWYVAYYVNVASTTGNPVVQTFTASGTYTPTPGMKYCVIKAVGGGGGGGGAGAGSVGTIGIGFGGGAGGESDVQLTSAQIGVSQAITIGAGGNGGTTGPLAPGGNGGTTSLGALIFCTGGIGGSINGVQLGPHSGIGGLGGVPTIVTGTILRTKNGEPGGFTFASITGTLGSGASGYGASSSYGTGGIGIKIFNPVAGALGANGIVGTGNGSGGSGGISAGTGAVPKTGGAGMPGLIIITEYFN
jgi:hypothetical protein